MKKTRLTLAEARTRKRQLYHRRASGELEPVLCWRKWTHDFVIMQVIGRSFVTPKTTTLEVKR